MASAECVFCRIVSGALSARKVLETAECVAFLDVAPLSPGHTLFVPRVHCASLEVMPAQTAAAMLGHLPALGKAVLTATGADGFNVLLNSGAAAGQVVMHAHFHIIPRRVGDGLGFRWRPQTLSGAEAELLRGRIVAALPPLSD